MKLKSKLLAPWEESYDNLDNILKTRDHFAEKVLYSQNCDFSSSHVRMWELDRKEA